MTDVRYPGRFFLSKLLPDQAVEFLDKLYERTGGARDRFIDMEAGQDRTGGLFAVVAELRARLAGIEAVPIDQLRSEIANLKAQVSALQQMAPVGSAPLATGNLQGPAASTDNAVVRWDGATARKVQNSGILVDDSNNVTGVVGLVADTDVLVVDPTNDRVGMGTTAPDTKLEVRQDVNGAVEVQARNGTAGASAYVGFVIRNDTGIAGYYWTGSSTYGTTHHRNRVLLQSPLANAGVSIVASAASGTVDFFTGSSALANKRGEISSSGDWSIGAAAAAESLKVIRVASAVERIEVRGATTGNHPSITAAGAGANLDLTLTPKGTGLLRYGTHSAIGAETVTGYITINDSGGTPRKLAVVS